MSSSVHIALPALLTPWDNILIFQTERGFIERAAVFDDCKDAGSQYFSLPRGPHSRNATHALPHIALTVWRQHSPLALLGGISPNRSSRPFKPISTNHRHKSLFISATRRRSLERLACRLIPISRHPSAATRQAMCWRTRGPISGPCNTSAIDQSNRWCVTPN